MVPCYFFYSYNFRGVYFECGVNIFKLFFTFAIIILTSELSDKILKEDGDPVGVGKTI